MKVELRNGTPEIMVRIAVVEGEDSLRFESSGRFTIEDDCHSKKIQGKPGQIWEVRVKGSQPATFVYSVRADLLTDQEQARRRLQEQKGRDASAHLLTAGQRLEHEGRAILDNREFWICAGEYPQPAEAQDRIQKEHLDDATVIRDMTGVPHGHVEALDPDGMALCLGRRVVVQPLEGAQIVLHGVPVGRHFHWEHREKLSFRGSVEFLIGNDGHLLAVNELPMEEYLISVNSSEMDARSPLEFLKAQTVAARSTILATAGKHHRQEPFDLCNGDHCQCYYGVVRVGEVSRKAVEQTLSQVLVSDGQICDARYSKVCGGIMEANEHVWPGEPISYMRSGVDAPSAEAAKGFYPIDSEDKARAWIQVRPEAYCNPDVSDLPEYMAYALKYFRWRLTCDRENLEKIIEKKSGRSIGILQDLKPLARGDSGRISRLAVIGSAGTLVLESELEIRRVLSESHLYSSCFVADCEKDANGRIETVILHGAGWGHGVGLCQVGAAMMAVRGKNHQQILAHYYQGSSLQKIL